MSARSSAGPRVDAREKTSGRALYLADIPVPDALSVRFLLSPLAHARIRSLILPHLPPGIISVDARDVPGKNAVSMIKENWPLFPEQEVSYVGQPVLLLAGPDPALLSQLLGQIVVEYQELPAVTSISEADASGPDHVFARYHLDFKAQNQQGGQHAKQDELVFEETFATGAQEHLYLEPQAVLAQVLDGRLEVTGSMQCPFYVRKALTTITGWDAGRIRVIQSVTGGGFGGKEDFPSVLAGYAAVTAIKAGKPVRIVLQRREDLAMTTKRHPSRITYRTTLDRAGNIRFARAEILTDGGAFEGLSSTVLQRTMFSAAGVYRIPRMRVAARALRTNLVPSGAFRGFGSPQAFFAMEMHMSHLARSRRENPLAFKKRFLLRRGDQTITGGLLRDPVKLEEMIETAAAASDYHDKYKRFPQERGELRRGIGVSLFSHGCGFTGSGERDIIKARVRLRRTAGNRVEILAASVEMGQGTLTVLRTIVARTLCIPVSRVVFSNPDTDHVPDSGPTVASRTVMVVGALLQRAARRLKELPEEEAEVEEEYTQPPEMAWDQETFTGDAYPAFSWGVNIVEVEVDPLTFEVFPRHVWAVYDVGEAIDEELVRAQCEGGIVQGLGYALTEVLEVGNGRYLQGSLTDYVIPGSRDIPEIDVSFVSNPYAYGPFGAKGAGELPFTGPAPAVADAVEHALGIRVDRIPLRPEYLEAKTP